MISCYVLRNTISCVHALKYLVFMCFYKLLYCVSLSITELLYTTIVLRPRQRYMVAAVGTVTLTPPQPFDFKRPDEWTRWKRRFKQFMSASGLDKEDESRQISTLLYCMGEEAEGVLASTNISEDSRKKYKDVMAGLDGYFQVRKNLLYERAKFNRRDQRDGESAEAYITALYELIET